MGACNRPDAIKRVTHIGDPVTQRIVHGVFQCAATGSYRHHFGTQKFHAEHVWRLTFHVVRAHVNHALQSEFRTYCGGCHTVLTSSGFSDDPRLAHAARQNDLTQHVVDLMCASVVQLVALHVDLRAPEFLSEALGKVERGRASNIVGPKMVHLVPECFVGLRVFVLSFQLENKRHQRFGDKAPAKITEPAIFVRACHKRIEKIVRHHSLQL